MKISFNQEVVSFRYNTFLKLLVFWYMFDTALLLPHYDDVYGDKSIYRLGFNADDWFTYLTSFLNKSYFLGDAYIFIIGQIFLGLVILLKKNKSKILHFVFFLISLNLERPVMYGLDGGNNLAQILYLYFFIFDWSNLSKAPIQFRKRTLLLSYLMTIIQVSFVYLTAGISKIKGEEWINGSALYYILQNPQYYSSCFSPILLSSTEFLKIGNFFTIFFQLSFPLIMIKRLNLAWIIVGVSIHLMIAFVMGLLPFGIFMMINYVLFVDVIMIKKAEFFYDKFKSLFRRKVQGSKWSILRDHF